MFYLFGTVRKQFLPDGIGVNGNAEETDAKRGKILSVCW